MPADMCQLDSWEHLSHPGASWKVLESLVGPLPPLVSEELFDPIPDDIIEHSLLLEPHVQHQDAPQLQPTSADLWHAYALQQGWDPDLAQQAYWQGTYAAQAAHQAHVQQATLGAMTVPDSQHTTPGNPYMQQQIFMPFNHAAAGWQARACCAQAWDNSFVGGKTGYQSAQGFLAQAAYGQHAPTPFSSYHGWGIQQESATPQQPQCRQHQQQRQQQQQPASAVMTMQAPYYGSAPVSGFAAGLEIVPALGHDHVATLLQRAGSSIALVDMAFPKSDTRSGSVEAAAAAAYAQGPGLLLQEKADVGGPVGGAGSRRQPGQTAVAQHANWYGADQRVSATNFVVTTGMGWPMQSS